VRLQVDDLELRHGFASELADVSAVLLWLPITHPDCDFGAIQSPGEQILPCVVVGVVIGTGWAACALAAVGQVRDGHPWRAALMGAA